VTYNPILVSFLLSAVFPAGAALILCLFVGGLRQPWRDKLQALILGGAFMGGAFLLLHRLNFPPSDVSESFSYIALLMAIFVFVAPKEFSARYGLRALFVLLFGGLLLWHIRMSLGGVAHLRNMLAFYCLALGVWSITERGSSQAAPLTILTLALIAATATSLLLLFSASASFSQLVSILCAILGAMIVGTWVCPQRISMAAVLPFASVFVVLFMAFGHFYLDVNPWHMVYLCLPFAVLWARPWLPIPKKPLFEAALLGLVSGLPLAYFVWTAFKAAGPLY
jgi:hypothetical protein